MANEPQFQIHEHLAQNFSCIKHATNNTKGDALKRSHYKPRGRKNTNSISSDYPLDLSRYDASASSQKLTCYALQSLIVSTVSSGKLSIPEDR